jgi:hypothetical protein
VKGSFGEFVPFVSMLFLCIVCMYCKLDIYCVYGMVYGILCISFGAMVFANGVEQQLIEVCIRVQCAM